MTTQLSARIQAHKANIDRYCRLLATELTDYERQYIHKRIAEEHALLSRLEAAVAQLDAPEKADADTVIAAQAMAKNHSGYSNL
jgi:5-bromo-4-chloroindolyl phosphate hydrolysis protein